MVHLDASLNQPVSTLSGGQRQLLCLLIAMLRPAPLVLLDEPLAALIRLARRGATEHLTCFNGEERQWSLLLTTSNTHVPAVTG